MAKTAETTSAHRVAIPLRHTHFVAPSQTPRNRYGRFVAAEMKLHQQALSLVDDKGSARGGVQY